VNPIARTNGAALLLLALAACSEPRAEPAGARSGTSAAPLELRTAAVERGAVQRVVSATGTLHGEEEATISAKVPGRIDAVVHDAGDEVAPGDKLARVEPTDYELALSERIRAFEQALASLGLESLPADGFSVDGLPAVERAALKSENAKARFERGRILHQRTPPAMSEQDFADLETAWEVAQAEHRLAQLEAREQLAAARTMQAQIDTARQRLADTVHVVPKGERPPPPGGDEAPESTIEYVVSARHVSAGDFVSVGTPMFELIDPDPLKLHVEIPERRIALVRHGQRVLLTVEAYPERFEGRVTRIHPAVNAKTRTFLVEVSVPNADRRLRAGSFAKLEIETSVDEGVLLVPRTAVLTFAGVHKVFVVVDGKAAERAVTLGGVVGDRIEITKGLDGSETIVTEPPAGLTTGAPIVAPAEGASR
jgi:multidrug efflux pump subunit AcrA (membrane-fusion protein)